MKDLIPCNDDIFISGAKLNFHLFKNLILKNRDLTFLHLISSSVLTGQFQNSDFYNASFLSTKFSGVYFDSCNLKSSDFCSVWAKDCYFNHSDFSDATISDSTFIHCTFVSTIFESVSLTNCQFVDCVFEQMPIDDSTVSLNTFTRCLIQSTHFTESFYYQIFEDCDFQNVEIDPVMLGYNLCFSDVVLHQLSEKADIVKVENDFLDKGLFVNAAILCINQARDYYDKAMIACVIALGKMIQQDILIKADEIQFLKKATSYLEEKNLIAPISIVQIWQLLNKLISERARNTALDKALPHLRDYANTLYFSYQRFQEHLQERLKILPRDSTSEAVELKVVFTIAPAVQFSIYLDEISRLCPGCPAHRLVRTEHGSYIEIHQIATEIIPYLQTLFSFLGIVVPFIVYHKQKKDQARSAVGEEAEESLQDAKEAPKQIVLTIQNTEKSSLLLPNTTVITSSTNAMISDVIRIINNTQLTDSLNFYGYNAKNIQSIKIYFS